MRLCQHRLGRFGRVAGADAIAGKGVQQLWLGAQPAKLSKAAEADRRVVVPDHPQADSIGLEQARAQLDRLYHPGAAHLRTIQQIPSDVPVEAQPVKRLKVFEGEAFVA